MYIHIHALICLLGNLCKLACAQRLIETLRQGFPDGCGGCPVRAISIDY